MLNFITGPAGSGKSFKINEYIRSEAEAGKEIFVIIPEQFSFEYERKMYFELGSSIFNNINVLSFTRLARLIFDRFGSRSGEYADDNAKVSVMFQTLRDICENRSLVTLGKQAASASFINDALEITADLRRASVSPEKFSSVILQADGKIIDKASDISVIYSAYDKKLAEHGFRDGLTDITESSAIANMNDFFSSCAFFVDEFDSFSPDELEMIETAVSEASDVYIALCTENAQDSEFSLFSTVNSTYKKLRNIAQKYGTGCRDIILDDQMRYNCDALSHLSRSVFRHKKKLCGSDGCVMITEARDLYQESDFVCSYIKYLVREKGYRYGDISIALRNPEDYDSILSSALERYEIPFFSDTEKPVMHTSLVIYFTSLLKLVSMPHPDTDTVMRYAKTLLAELEIVEISELENYCFRWNVEGKMWESEFTGTVRGAEGETEKAENFRIKLLGPVLELREKCRNSDASKICEYIWEHIEKTGVTDRVSSLIELYRENILTDMASEISRLWECIMGILDSVSSVLKNDKITVKQFCDLFTVMIRQNKFLNPPQRLDVVSVVSAQKARLNSPKAMFVMGVNEGIIPASVKSSGLLSDHEKEAFARAGLDISRDTQRMLSDERFMIYRLLSFASEKLFLTYSLSDAAGNSRFPSYIIPQIAEMFSDNIRNSASGFDILFYSPTAGSAYYNYIRNYYERSVKTESLRKALMSIPEYADRIRYIESVNTDADHEVKDPELMKRLLSDRLVISATSFQEYNLCRFKYFCHHALRIRAREQKEISLLEMGNLVHMCLEKIFAGCSSREEFLELSRERIVSFIDQFAEEFKESELGGSFGKDARLDAKFRRLYEDTVTLVEHLKEELRQSKFMPLKYEFEISQGEHSGQYIVKTSSGVEVILRGKIDRIDVYEDGAERFIRVIDYKTGEQVFNIDNVLFGIDMQMILYLFSVTGKDSPFGETVPAGVLYMPSGKISLERERGSGSEEKESYLNKFYHMNGVLLKESRILEAMEENIDGVYIPARLTSQAKKSGTFVLDKTKSSCLTRVQFERLRVHAQKLIRNMAEDLYSGKISASPLIYGKKDVCSYCEYWDVCGNVPRMRQRCLPDDKEEKERIRNDIIGND